MGVHEYAFISIYLTVCMNTHMTDMVLSQTKPSKPSHLNTKSSSRFKQAKKYQYMQGHL